MLLKAFIKTLRVHRDIREPYSIFKNLRDIREIEAILKGQQISQNIRFKFFEWHFYLLV